MSESYNQYGLGPTTLCAHGLPNLDTRCPYCERDALRAEVERLRKALAACTERLRHLHGLRMEGEPKALDFSHEFVLIRKARTANLTAPAEAEGRRAAEREERGKEKGDGA